MVLCVASWIFAKTDKTVEVLGIRMEGFRMLPQKGIPLAQGIQFVRTDCTPLEVLLHGCSGRRSHVLFQIGQELGRIPSLRTTFFGVGHLPFSFDESSE
jgi:hypothetical protein